MMTSFLTKILFLITLSGLIVHGIACDLDVKIQELTSLVKQEQKEISESNFTDIDHITKTIARMYQIDQTVRNELISHSNNPKTKDLIDSMDHFHTKKMKAIIENIGWPKISLFGEIVDRQAWLLIQHADDDPAFQERCLDLLTNLLDQQETSPKNYAFLYDRVALKSDRFEKIQRFGTQVLVDGDTVTLQPCEGTLAEVDERRKLIGLESIDNYLETVKNMYVKENS